MKQCPLCFSEIQEEAIKCRYCKAAIDYADSSSVLLSLPQLQPQIINQAWPSAIGYQEQPTDTTLPPPDGKIGIRGWLLVFTIALILGCIDGIGKIAAFLLATDAFNIPLNRVIFPCNILAFSLALLTLYFIFTKKMIAPVVFILFKLFSLFTGFLIYYGAVNYQVQFTAGSTSNFAQTIGEAIGLLLIVPYLVLSKRVRATFVRPLKNEIIFDRLWIPFQPRLDKFSAFLWRTKNFIIVELIAFIMTSMIVSHALAMLLR